MAYIEVDVDLDDFDNEDIINEVKKRWSNKWKKFNPEEKQELKSICGLGLAADFNPSNLQEQMMCESFVNHLDRITPEKLDAFLKTL